LIATPTMDEAARCHRAGLLFEGQLLEEGQPNEMLHAFTHPVFRVQGERAKAAVAVEKDTDVLASTPAGAELRIVVRKDRQETVLKVLADLGAKTSLATATFEDLFLTRLRERTETKHEKKSVS
jgi:ABC-type multidrug transport system ATPase subunit